MSNLDSWYDYANDRPYQSAEMTTLETVAAYLAEIYGATETQEDIDNLHDSFAFPSELHDAVRAAMIAAATQDEYARAETGATIPDDPAAPWGKWHRAANIVGYRSENWARSHDLRLCCGDWSWFALLSVMGVERTRSR